MWQQSLSSGRPTIFYPTLLLLLVVPLSTFLPLFQCTNIPPPLPAAAAATPDNHCESPLVTARPDDRSEGECEKSGHHYHKRSGSDWWWSSHFQGYFDTGESDGVFDTQLDSLHAQLTGILWLEIYLITMVLIAIAITLVLIAAVLALLVWTVRKTAVSTKKKHVEGKIEVGFFHPYCNAGGGGERVLWSAVNAVHDKYKDCHVIIYTGDVDATATQIIATVEQRFGTVLDASRLEFVFLHKRGWVEAACYPSFTMIRQSIGSIVLGYEAFCQRIPDIFIDSMGYAFVLPLFRYFGKCRVGAYVHYPTISTDMLRRVANQESSFNNNTSVSGSTVRTKLKLVYYNLFAKLYGLVGRSAEAILVNSSWTKNHINSIWGVQSTVVAPPCDTDALQRLDLNAHRIPGMIVSVAQFRPEKDHGLQIRALRELFSKHPEMKETTKLVLIGGCRNAGDETRVAALRSLAAELNVAKNVEFGLNVSYDVLKEKLSQGIVGIHTMKDEHFGIGVVEFMAAGAIALAHNSAGPRQDIVVPVNGQPTGFLAATADEYAEHLHHILNLSKKERANIQERARTSVVERFSEEAFQQHFLASIEPLFEQ